MPFGLRNCDRCGKAYNSANPRLCPECADAEEEEFKGVRKFIKDNPKVSLEVVAEATGVAEDRIRDYLREGRIESADLNGPVLECRRCGKPIYRGEYCVLCQSELQQTFRSGLEDRPAKASKGADSKPRSFARRYRNR